MAEGFLLTNQLTDFSATPVDAANLPVANRVAPQQTPAQHHGANAGIQGQRAGRLPDGTGSPGGGAIIQYVLKP